MSLYPVAYASNPDGALLIRQFLLLLAKAHLAGQANRSHSQSLAHVGPSLLPLQDNPQRGELQSLSTFYGRS